MSNCEIITSDGCTAEEASVIDFQPLTAEELQTCKPPNNEELVRIFEGHLSTLRIAWLVLGMSKPSLVGMLQEMDDEIGVSMVDRIESAIRFFEQGLSTLNPAFARIVVAGSVLEVTEEAEQ